MTVVRELTVDQVTDQKYLSENKIAAFPLARQMAEEMAEEGIVFEMRTRTRHYGDWNYLHINADNWMGVDK